MLRKHYPKLITTLLIACSLRCSATTIVVLVASDGIVIASDSKMDWYSDTRFSESGELHNKTVVLTDRIAVAIMGASGVKSTATDGRILYEFDAKHLLDETKQALGPNASLSQIQNVIKDKLKMAMGSVPPYLVDRSIQEQNAIGGHFVNFIIAGYEDGAPVVRDVRGKRIRNALNVTQVIVEAVPVFPLPNDPPDSHLIVFGASKGISNFLNNPESSERKAASTALLSAMDAMDDRKYPNSVAAVAIASELIRMESKAEPSRVGLPVNIVVLSNSRSPKISSVPK